MPNWCDNAATLTASKEKIDALVAVLENKDDQQVFQHLRPRPESEEENWYEWNCNNWGTKWDASNITIEDSTKNSILLTFDTAWSPPQAWFDYMHDRGFYIEAMFIECGCDFIGCYIAGEYTSENFNDGTMNWDDDNFSEQEDARIEKFMIKHGLDHSPSHTGG